VGRRKRGLGKKKGKQGPEGNWGAGWKEGGRKEIDRGFSSKGLQKKERNTGGQKIQQG